MDTHSESNGATDSLMHLTLPRTLPIKRFKLEHEFFANPRTDTGLDDLRPLEADIEARGIVTDLLVVPALDANAPEGWIPVVFDGQRRVMAGRNVLKSNAEIGVKYIGPDGPMEDPTPIDLTWEVSDKILLHILAVGVQREGLSSYELSTVAERLKNRSQTLDTIAAAIGRSESWVSRMLTARGKASPETLKQWRTGKLTDEQFKDVARIGTPEDQKEALDDAKTAASTAKNPRQAKAEARAKIKERATKVKDTEKKAKSDKKAAKAEAKKPAKQQQSMFEEPKKDDEPKFKRPTNGELAALLELADARPPTHDYVKGIIEGVRYAQGQSAPEVFARPYGTWIARVGGSSVTSKAKPAKKARKKGKK